MEVEDRELVERALAGSQAAYRALVERYERPLFSLLVRMLRDRALAEDLSQETFVKAFSKLDTYDRGRKFSSWLFKIGHNTAIDELRKKRLATVSLASSREEDAPTLEARLPAERTSEPGTRLEQVGLRGALEAAIGELRPEYREAMLLRFREGLSYEEVAEILEIPLGTLKTRLHRARKEMAGWLAEQGYEPVGQGR